jgi:hypothetical protein
MTEKAMSFSVENKLNAIVDYTKITDENSNNKGIK